MPTVYPGAIDSFVNPTDTDTLASPPHDGQHADANDAVEAVEAELGINPRGAFATVRARLDDVGVWGTWVAAYVNLTVADGTVVSRFVQIGKTVHAKFELTFGATTTIDASAPTISVPVTSTSLYTNELRLWIGGAQLLNSGFATHPGLARLASTSTFEVMVYKADATYTTIVPISATVPHTWGEFDVLSFAATYEVA